MASDLPWPLISPLACIGERLATAFTAEPPDRLLSSAIHQRHVLTFEADGRLRRHVTDFVSARSGGDTLPACSTWSAGPMHRPLAAQCSRRQLLPRPGTLALMILGKSGLTQFGLFAGPSQRGSEFAQFDRPHARLA